MSESMPEPTPPVDTPVSADLNQPPAFTASQLRTLEELHAYGKVIRPVESPVSVTPDLTPPMTFDFTADFTGQMGSLGDFRFKPLVPIVKGQRYAVSIDRETGATTMEPIAPDPYAGVKAKSADLWGKFESRRRWR